MVSVRAHLVGVYSGKGNGGGLWLFRGDLIPPFAHQLRQSSLTSRIVKMAEVAASINDGRTHLLLAATGSVATIKLPLIISSFERHPNLSIRVILTKSAAHFLAGQSPEQPTVESLSSLPHVDGVYRDEDEWAVPWTREASILHIELRRWAHLLAIVPLSANVLAKMTGGLCDDLLTTVIRAWDTGTPESRGPPILVAPAMNSMMWTHPLTSKQLSILENEWWWVEILPAQSKTLACGDTGQGGMCEWKKVVSVIEERLELSRVYHRRNLISTDAV